MSPHCHHPQKTKVNPSTFARALRLLATFLQFLEDAADRLRPSAPRCWDSEQRCRKWIVKLCIYIYIYMVSVNIIYIYIIIIICIYHICVQPAKTANETRSCEGFSAEVCARTSGSTGEWTPDISTLGHLGQNHALNILPSGNLT